MELLLIVVCLQASVLVAVCRTILSLNRKVNKLEKIVDKQDSRIKALMLIARVLRVKDED
jgi:hypothetical protein